LFRRFKNSDDDPIANQLSDLAEPNTLNLGKVPAKPGKSGKSGKGGKGGKGGKSPEWTAEVVDDGIEPFEEEFGETDEDEEEDDRTPETSKPNCSARPRNMD
jgi:hypothetical protein